MGFFNKIFGVKSEDAEVSNGELKNELGELKKILRKQSVVIEMFKDEVIEHVDTKSVKDISHEMLKDMADSFFYLQTIIGDSFHLSDNQQESFAISWTKIEDILGLCGLELIRKSGSPFDARMHEAVGDAEALSGALQVKRVVQPGYIYQGKVLRPAKVVLGEGED